MVSNRPHHFSSLQGDVKTLITIDSALLGLTVTFAKDFIADDASRSWVGMAWLALSFSIAAAVLGSASLYNRLRRGDESGGKAVLGVNASFFLLVIGSSLLAFGAWRGWTPDGSADEIGSAVSSAEEAINEFAPNTSFELQSLERTANTVFVIEATDGDERRLVVEIRDGRVAQVRLLDSRSLSG